MIKEFQQNTKTKTELDSLTKKDEIQTCKLLKQKKKKIKLTKNN